MTCGARSRKNDVYPDSGDTVHADKAAGKTEKDQSANITQIESIDGKPESTSVEKTAVITINVLAERRKKIFDSRGWNWLGYSIVRCYIHL